MAIAILKMAIFDKVDYIDIEPALACVHVMYLSPGTAKFGC